MRALIIVLFTVLMSGCAQDALKKQTASGYPEGIFRNSNLSDVRSKLVSGCMDKGLQIEDGGSGQIVCSKEMDGLQGSLTQLALANSYSTTPQMKVKFVSAQVGADVRVIAYPWIESTMPLGQVRKAEAKSNNDINAIQGFLNSLGAN
ncbi:hypothetical protein [Pseudomonas oryzihabitans]|uniref:hypothetical protein n=2 Tax=Pseudomonas oryzihabitans TaxID=47885 RepID=UPI00111D91BC|nr:hypothetical protein [Pseudomonas psychrotolerans]